MIENMQIFADMDHPTEAEKNHFEEQPRDVIALWR